MDDLGESGTERIRLSPWRFHRREALALINNLAGQHELEVDRVEEQPRRLSVDLFVTVRGDPRNIDSFCKAAGGRREREAPRRLRRVIGAAIEGVLSNWPWQ